jgi:phosphoribosyl 1,2-cyclic phosphodiesterase
VDGPRTFRFAVLGSGSAGNSLLLSTGGESILLDAGLSCAQTFERARRVGIDPETIKAILVTHEHSDHVVHAGRLSKVLGAPIFASEGTLKSASRHFAGAVSTEVIRSGESFRLGSVEVEPVKKPHDAAEPLSFLLHKDDVTLGFFTDLGHVDESVADALSRCDLLMMEANHDSEMLERGPYPPYLRRRVGGKWGHISNDLSARSLAKCIGSRLRTLILGHLSTKNNHPDLVRQSFRKHLGENPGFPRFLSLQDRPLGPFDEQGRLLRLSEGKSEVPSNPR